MPFTVFHLLYLYTVYCYKQVKHNFGLSEILSNILLSVIYNTELW